MSRRMEITFTRLDDRGTDRAELVDFLTSHEFPFHVTRRPARTAVEGWIDEGRFGDADHASYWIDTNEGWIDTNEGRIGLVTLHDLNDDAPLFDLRLATEHRGKGLGARHPIGFGRVRHPPTGLANRPHNPRRVERPPAVTSRGSYWYEMKTGDGCSLVVSEGERTGRSSS
jgi:hypothetical protein